MSEKHQWIEDDGVEQYKLSKEEVAVAANFSRAQIRSMVDYYYSMQKQRLRASNKSRANSVLVDIPQEEEIDLITRFKTHMEYMEGQAARAMCSFVESQPLGRWATSIAGVGPIVTAGLLAHIDLTIAKTAGAIWKFAGLLDPKDIKWEKGTKRPYNAALKTLCWKIGEGFKKLSARDKSVPELTEEILKKAEKKREKITPKQAVLLATKKRVRAQARMSKLDDESYLYVRLYMQRKDQEVERNENGMFAEQAKRMLAMANKRGVTLSDAQRDCWASGRLQPIGLDRRASRFAVKIFLSHYFSVGRDIMGLPHQIPWIIQFGGHAHEIAVPNWPANKMKEVG